MARTDIDIDEAACAEVMRRHHLTTKGDAVNFALRAVSGEALGRAEAAAMKGSGWVGDLDDMRASRAASRGQHR